MDYNKMTKNELIEELKNKEHLAKAVEDKDKTITNLQKETSEEIKSLKEQLKNSMPESKAKEMEQRLECLTSIANIYITAYRDLLKQQKINLDIAISHEDLMAKELKGV